ncbi:MAG: DsbA family protein [Myxococcota bacterium]
MTRRTTTRGLAGSAGFGLLLAGLLGITGCEQMPWAEGDEKAAAEEGDQGGPCDRYAGRICKEVGEQSQTCAQVKTASGLLPPAACEEALANVEYSLEKLTAERAECDELVEKLCDDLGEDTESCAMVKEQTPQFPPERCKMMLGQYDKVVADLQKREAMNKPLPEEKVKELASGDAPAFGPEQAKVTIVEFSDFECPYCGKAAEVAEKVREKYGDRVRFVFRQYPLPMHSNAKQAAQAALAAEEQGKFWDYHDKLFENQRKLDQKSLEKHAEELGLDVAKFSKALEEGRFSEQIERDMELGQQVHVRGTPTMFLNGKRISNPTSFELVSQMIEKELG